MLIFLIFAPLFDWLRIDDNLSQSTNFLNLHSSVLDFMSKSLVCRDPIDFGAWNSCTSWYQPDSGRKDKQATLKTAAMHILVSMKHCFVCGNRDPDLISMGFRLSMTMVLHPTNRLLTFILWFILCSP